MPSVFAGSPVSSPSGPETIISAVTATTATDASANPRAMKRCTKLRPVVAHAVAVVERVAGRHEQVARQPPGDQQRADRDVAMRLGELRVHERRGRRVGEIRPHQDADGVARGLLRLRDHARADEPLREPERRADRDRRGHQRQHCEERHLGRVPSRAVRLRPAPHLDQQRPRTRVGESASSLQRAVDWPPIGDLPEGTATPDAPGAVPSDYRARRQPGRCADGSNSPERPLRWYPAEGLLDSAGFRP